MAPFKYNKRLNLVLIILLICPSSAIAGTKADALYKEAINAKSLTAGISICKKARQEAVNEKNSVLFIKATNLLAEYYWQGPSNDSAKIYAQNALTEAEKYQIDSLKGDSWMILGLADFRDDAYAKAIEKYNKSLVIYTIYKKRLYLAITYKNIGICESELSDYSGAIPHYLNSISIFQSLNDGLNLASAYNSVANCFASLKNYNKSILYHKKALLLRTQLKNERLVAQSYNNIGFVFKEMGSPDSAIYYLTQSIYLYKKLPDSSLLVSPLQNLSTAWRLKKNLPKASLYVARSMNIASKYAMKEEYAGASIDLAKIYCLQEKWTSAEKIIDKAIITIQQLNLPELLIDAYNIKVDILKHNGDYKAAFFWKEKTVKLNDSVFSIRKNKDIEELEIKYQAKQSEKDIAVLNTQNRLENKLVNQQKVSIITLTAASLLLMLLLIITYFSFVEKRKANLRIKTLMHDLHHRVKNNLQILSGLFTMQIENLENGHAKNALRENETRLASMNLIHNKLYLDDSTTQIDMHSYLPELLQHVKSSFGNSQKTDIILRMDIEPLKLEADKAVALGLIVNELATNSFKYAFNEKGGEIILSLKKRDRSGIVMIIGDTGKGITDVKSGNSGSFGLKLVNLMARQLGAQVTIEKNNGTIYCFEINV